MYQTHVHGREKCPKQPCKKHRSKDLLKKKILASMTEKGRKKYQKRKKEETRKRREARKTAKMIAHKLRIEGKKVCKKQPEHITIQLVKVKKIPPSIETIVQKKYRTEQRRLKRKLLKIIHYAERNGTDSILVVKKLFYDLGLYFSKKIIQVRKIAMQLFCAGIKNISVNKYQIIASS